MQLHEVFLYLNPLKLFNLFPDTESQSRMVDPNYAPGHKVMFSDGYPFLLLSQVI